MAVVDKIKIFQDVMPYRLVDKCSYFRGICCFHLQGMTALKKKAAGSPKTLISSAKLQTFMSQRLYSIHFAHEVTYINFDKIIFSFYMPHIILNYSE
jgi:hypothetical protein